MRWRGGGGNEQFGQRKFLIILHWTLRVEEKKNGRGKLRGGLSYLFINKQVKYQRPVNKSTFYDSVSKSVRHSQQKTRLSESP